MSISVFLIGGFFVLRNVWSTGHLISPDLEYGGFQRSLSSNFARGSYTFLHGLRLEWLSCFALLTPFLIAYLYLRLRSTEVSWPRRVMLWLLGLNVLALLVFVATPFVVDGPVAFQTRLGMPLFCTMGIVLAVILAIVAAYLSLWKIPWQVALIVLGLALVLALPWWWHRNCVHGLPGKGNNSVYSWVHAQSASSALRVYSIGLRPYGLYGIRCSTI